MSVLCGQCPANSDLTEIVRPDVAFMSEVDSVGMVVELPTGRVLDTSIAL